jgi:putative cell wall-binding protein
VSLALGLGIGAGVLGLVVVIQTVRLKSAKRQLDSAKKAVEDANAAKQAAERRIADEKRIDSKYEQKKALADERLKAAIAALEAREKSADDKLKAVEDAHGDDEETLSLLRDALRRHDDDDDEGDALPERSTVDTAAGPG